MRIRVRLFAMLREQAGWRERDIDLPPGASIEDAWLVLLELVPAIAASRESVRFARNRQYAAADEPLADGDELVLIPPVAGGDPVLRRCEITPDPIGDELLAELRRTVPTPADGALVVFVGQTRESAGTPAPGEEQEAARFEDERVVGLEYETFDEMATEVLRAIAAEIETQFGVRRLAMIHRSGDVPLGEASVVVCVAARHRGAAFDAARYAIDELKARAPIWKREHYELGAVWIGQPARSGPEGGEQAT